MPRTRLSRKQVASGAIDKVHLNSETLSKLIHIGSSEDVNKHVWFNPSSNDLMVKTPGGWRAINKEFAAESVNGLKFRVSDGRLQVSVDNGLTWNDV